MERVLVRNRTRATVVAQAELADGWLTRLRGLIGHSELAPGEGMIIEPCSSIHTFFMGFPIDVVFVSREGRVLRVAPAVPPWRVGPVARGARYVIELPAGALAGSRTQVGDELDWVR